jgi:hypothetical protein
MEVVLDNALIVETIHTGITQIRGIVPSVPIEYATRIALSMLSSHEVRLELGEKILSRQGTTTYQACSSRFLKSRFENWESITDGEATTLVSSFLKTLSDG